MNSFLFLHRNSVIFIIVVAVVGPFFYFSGPDREILEAQKIQLFCFQRVNYFPFDRFPFQAVRSFITRPHPLEMGVWEKKALLNIEHKVIGVRTKGQPVQKNGREHFSFHSCNDECSFIKFSYNRCTRNDNSTLRGQTSPKQNKMRKKVKMETKPIDWLNWILRKGKPRTTSHGRWKIESGAKRKIQPGITTRTKWCSAFNETKKKK